MNHRVIRCWWHDAQNKLIPLFTLMQKCLSEYRLQDLGVPNTTKARLNIQVKSQVFHLQGFQGISYLTHGAAAIKLFVGRRGTECMLFSHANCNHHSQLSSSSSNHCCPFALDCISEGGRKGGKVWHFSSSSWREMIRHSLTEQAGFLKQNLNPVYSLVGFFLLFSVFFIYSTPAHYLQVYHRGVLFYSIQIKDRGQ